METKSILKTVENKRTNKFAQSLLDNQKGDDNDSENIVERTYKKEVKKEIKEKKERKKKENDKWNEENWDRRKELNKIESKKRTRKIKYLTEMFGHLVGIGTKKFVTINPDTREVIDPFIKEELKMNKMGL